MLTEFPRGPFASRGPFKPVRVEPTILVEHGRILHGGLRHARLIEADLMEAARSSQGIETVAEIKFAILERNGKISVIPRD